MVACKENVCDGQGTKRDPSERQEVRDDVNQKRRKVRVEDREHDTREKEGDERQWGENGKGVYGRRDVRLERWELRQWETRQASIHTVNFSRYEIITRLSHAYCATYTLCTCNTCTCIMHHRHTHTQ